MIPRGGGGGYFRNLGMIHPPDPSGRHLLAFDCRLRMVSEKGTQFAKQQQKRTYQASEWVSSTRHAPKPNST